MSLILTLNNANVRMTDEEAGAAIKRLLSALRRKASREEWSYYIFIGFIRSNQKIKAERPHFHICLFADPCWTVAQWINDYWTPAKSSRRKSRGFVKKKAIDGQKARYFVNGYIRGQSVFTREQKTDDLRNFCDSLKA